MGHILRLFIPKPGEGDHPGEITRNNKLLVHLGHELRQQFRVLRVCVLVLDGVLPGGGVGGPAHVAGHRLITQSLARADQSLLNFQERGGVGGRSLGIHHLGLVAGAHFHDHARPQFLAGVVHAAVRPANPGPPQACPGRNGLFDQHRQAGRDPLLDGYRVYKLVHVPDPGDRVGHIRHFPDLAGPPFRFQEIGVLGVNVDRLQQAPPLQVILLDPVAHRPAPGIIFDPAHDAVSLPVRGALCHVQFVHLNGLQLERHHAAGGVAEQEQDPAVHLLALHGHA